MHVRRKQGAIGKQEPRSHSSANLAVENLAEEERVGMPRDVDHIFVTGHFKTSQSGSNQNQPPERGRDGESLGKKGQV